MFEGHKKFVVLVLLVLAVMFIVGVGETTSVDFESKVFLPVVTSDDDCLERIGVAWFYNRPKGNNDLNRLCADYYYHSGTVRAPSSINVGGIPMFWCDTDPQGSDYFKLAEELWSDYDGIALVMNEPDLPEQCNRDPQQMAKIFHTLETHMPKAKLIIPNLSQLTLRYLGLFIDKYEWLYGYKPQPYRWSLHYYSSVDPGISGFLDEYCEILISRGYKCENLWVTEMGTTLDMPDAYERMYMLTKFLLEDPRIERFFVYTNRSSEDNLNRSYLIDSEGKLTVLGEAFDDAIKDRPMKSMEH